VGERMHDARGNWPDDLPSGQEEEFAELVLLLPNWQLEALERVASRRAVTMGQLLRRLIRDGLAGLDDAPAGLAKVPGLHERGLQCRAVSEITWTENGRHKMSGDGTIPSGWDENRL
jgi:hypothetical protein